jgi:hypothetical protein
MQHRCGGKTIFPVVSDVHEPSPCPSIEAIMCSTSCPLTGSVISAISWNVVPWVVQRCLVLDPEGGYTAVIAQLERVTECPAIVIVVVVTPGPEFGPPEGPNGVPCFSSLIVMAGDFGQGPIKITLTTWTGPVGGVADTVGDPGWTSVLLGTEAMMLSSWR